jgi:hypothetical protein
MRLSVLKPLKLAALGALLLSTFPPAAGAQEADATPAATTQTSDASPDRRAQMSEAFGQDTLENGKFLWKDGVTEVDRLAISLAEQLIYAYDDDRLVAVSTVSTGRPGYETRPGSFRILAKNRTYFSRKYDNAPMPFMQLITTYGVALHAGNLPGNPASHGCIRLPTDFAAKLFEVTSIGTPVVISN